MKSKVTLIFIEADYQGFVFNVESSKLIEQQKNICIINKGKLVVQLILNIKIYQNFKTYQSTTTLKKSDTINH